MKNENPELLLFLIWQVNVGSKFDVLKGTSSSPHHTEKKTKHRLQLKSMVLSETFAL